MVSSTLLDDTFSGIRRRSYEQQLPCLAPDKRRLKRPGTIDVNPISRHHSLASHLKRRFGAHVRKIPLDAGAGCPNRDGTLGRSGCIFCNPKGSGSGLLAQGLDLAAQWEYWRARFVRRGADRFLAYLQSYTNTYGPPERLAALLERLAGLPGLVGLCVGTRPDCCENDKLDRLAAFRDTLPLAPDGSAAPIILELGLQSADDAVLTRIRRGHDAACFADATKRAAARGLEVCAHVVAGLPGVTDGGADLCRSVAFLNALPVAHVKFHNCYVCSGSGLAAEWRSGRYAPPSLPDYAAWLTEALADLRPGTVVHRLVADPDPGELLAPDWAACKAEVLAIVRRRLELRHLWQGCRAGCPDAPPDYPSLFSPIPRQRLLTRVITPRVTEWIVSAPLALELHWEGETLLGCAITECAGITSSPALTPAGKALAGALDRYVVGKPDPWPALKLDWRGITPFARRVLETLVRKVPSGHTITYGELACLAGSPRAARAVGRVLAANRWPLLIPCHRVLGVGGHLGGYSGRGGLPLKRRLLEMEARTSPV